MTLRDKKMISYYIEGLYKTTCYKTKSNFPHGKNLKMLIEIFCQKLIVSNVILAFLDHLKPKIFFVGQPWWRR